MDYVASFYLWETWRKSRYSWIIHGSAIVNRWENLVNVSFVKGGMLRSMEGVTSVTVTIRWANYASLLKYASAEFCRRDVGTDSWLPTSQQSMRRAWIWNFANSETTEWTCKSWKFCRLTWSGIALIWNDVSVIVYTTRNCLKISIAHLKSIVVVLELLCYFCWNVCLNSIKYLYKELQFFKLR